MQPILKVFQSIFLANHSQKTKYLIYIFVSRYITFSNFSGLIALVVILVSLFPLPIDKLKNWFISKTRECFTEKLLPCSELVVTDVWTVSLPKLTSESAVRILDVTSDGIDDVIFGYGTGTTLIIIRNIQ